MVKNVYESKSIIWYLNLDCESTWYKSEENLSNETNSLYNYESLLLHCAKEDDLVILKRKDSLWALDTLEESDKKFQILVLSDSPYEIELVLLSQQEAIDQIALSLNRGYELIPFGITKRTNDLFSKTQAGHSYMPEGLPEYIGNKISQKTIINDLKIPAPTFHISSMEKLSNVYDSFEKDCDVIIKDPKNSSGRGLFVIKSKTQLDYLLLYLKKIYSEDYQFLMEEFVPSEYSLSFQFVVGDDGCHLQGAFKQVLAITIFKGCLSLSFSDVIALIGHENFNLVERIAKYLQLEKGYRGVFGIDTVMTIKGEFYPLIEINPRNTLAVYSTIIQKKYNFAYSAMTIIDKQIATMDVNKKEIFSSLTSISIPGISIKIVSINTCHQNSIIQLRVMVIFLSDNRIFDDNFSKMKNLLENTLEKFV